MLLMMGIWRRVGMALDGGWAAETRKTGEPQFFFFFFLLRCSLLWGASVGNSIKKIAEASFVTPPLSDADRQSVRMLFTRFVSSGGPPVVSSGTAEEDEGRISPTNMSV